MGYVIFDVHPTYHTALLIKKSSAKKGEMFNSYVMPLRARGDTNTVVGYSLEYNTAKKAPISLIKECCENMLRDLKLQGVQTLYVADAAYFKYLAGEKQAEKHLGYAKKCAIPGYEDMAVILGVNYHSVFHNPANEAKLEMSLNCLADHNQNNLAVLGQNIIHSEKYPEDIRLVELALNGLHQHPTIACDIEAFSLDFYNAGLATIGFSWDEHNGIAINVDYDELATPKTIDGVTYYGEKGFNPSVRRLLKEFFMAYKGNIIYQNGNYDIKVLIYELFMDNLLDTEGMLEGLEIMTANIDDTKIITYLATNSTAGNKLGLKENAHEFAGNYGQSSEDIKDVRRIPKKDLLRYNLVDCLSTFYVYKKNQPIMVADNQQSVYEDILLKSVKLILQMELTGAPLDMPQVLKTQTFMTKERDDYTKKLFSLPCVNDFQNDMRHKEYVTKNSLWVSKQEPLEYFNYVKFNPASNKQIGELIYTKLGYPVLDTTATKAPSVGGKTLKKLFHRAKTQEHKDMFSCLMGLSEVSKILDTFIAAFLGRSVKKPDGTYYLHGSFNIGGTVSGRLSSSGPNMQNIPSTGSKYAKAIKKCFKAPDGWLMVGADFASLEDRISALTTKDPNKLKVYTDGYDGHCLRAFTYFGHKMPDIVNTVESINSIADHPVYADYRQDSKAPTFLLTYQGTYHGLMNNLGLSEQEAKSIESHYHKLYAKSDAWVQSKLLEATKVGYVTCAFGLRVRTPLLAKTILNSKSTPYEAKAEGRTAGNALGQSYGLLNNRAGIEFQEMTLASEHRLDILPMLHIHDSQYFLVRNNLGCLHWLNDNLPNCMKWQQLPDIMHPDVKLGGDVEVYYPDWSNKFTLPNHATMDEIEGICKP